MIIREAINALPNNDFVDAILGRILSNPANIYNDLSAIEKDLVMWLDMEVNVKDDKLDTNDEFTVKETIVNTPCDENKKCKECENYTMCYSVVFGILKGSM